MCASPSGLCMLPCYCMLSCILYVVMHTADAINHLWYRWLIASTYISLFRTILLLHCIMHTAACCRVCCCPYLSVYFLTYAALWFFCLTDFKAEIANENCFNRSTGALLSSCALVVSSAHHLPMDDVLLFQRVQYLYSFNHFPLLCSCMMWTCWCNVVKGHVLITNHVNQTMYKRDNE